MQINNTNVNKTTGLLQQTQQKQNDVMRQLASGKRVDRAADDAAAIQIAARLTAESEAYQRSLGNAYDGISMLSVAEGGLSNVNDNLSRIRELTLQAGNGALTDSDRQAIQGEIDQLRGDIDTTLERTEFAGKPLLTEDTTENFQVGSSADTQFAVQLQDMRGQFNALNSLNVTDPDSRDNLLKEIDAMAESIQSQRAEYGAQQNALLSTARNLSQGDEHMQAARSQLQDLDYAMGTAEHVKHQIIFQSQNSILSQANAQAQSVLSLIS